MHAFSQWCGINPGIHTSIIFMFIASLIIPSGASAESASQPDQIDMLDYMLQTDDTANTWTLMGFDMKMASDPEGKFVETYVGHKFSLPGAFEVFNATDQWIYIRYESARYSGAAGTDNWIRRFEEAGPHQSRLGARWCPRFVTPGEPGFESRHVIDRFVFDNDKRIYAWDGDGSTTDSVNFISVKRSNVPSNLAPDVRIMPNDTIRIVQEWHPLGLIVEMYDYAKGKGIVAWRWLERLDWIMQAKQDSSGEYYHSEYGSILIVPACDDNFEPEIYAYDPKTKERGKRLAVLCIKSHWLPDSPPNWYIVTNDTLGNVVDYKEENIPVDYTLPEWLSRPGATIADLPYVNTTEGSDLSRN